MICRVAFEITMQKEILDQLTKQQIKVLKFCFEGYSNKEIADKLFISIKTVKRHKQDIMRTFKLKGQKEFRTFLNTIPNHFLQENL